MHPEFSAVNQCYFGRRDQAKIKLTKLKISLSVIFYQHFWKATTSKHPVTNKIAEVFSYVTL